MTYDINFFDEEGHFSPLADRLFKSFMENSDLSFTAFKGWVENKYDVTVLANENDPIWMFKFESEKHYLAFLLKI